MRITDKTGRVVDVTAERTQQKENSYIVRHTVECFVLSKHILKGSKYYPPSPRYDPRIDATVVDDIERCIETLREWERKEDNEYARSVTIEDFGIVEKPTHSYSAAEIDEIVKGIRESNMMDHELLMKLCDASGIFDEWCECNEKMPRQSALDAAEKLGVEIQ